jgi:hypothetical protein
MGINKHDGNFPAKIGRKVWILVKIMLFLGYFAVRQRDREDRIQGAYTLKKREYKYPEDLKIIHLYRVFPQN